MSYDVSLCDPVTGKTLESPERFEEGGTYPLGGTTECSLNITYNYSEVFGPLVSDLHSKTAAETVGGLRGFVAAWPDTRPYERDYWAPTPGNARVAVERLITFADTHPNGVWSVS